MQKPKRRGIGSVEWMAFLAVLAIVGIWIIGAVGGRPLVPFEQAEPVYPAGQMLPEDRAAAELLDGSPAGANLSPSAASSGVGENSSAL